MADTTTSTVETNSGTSVITDMLQGTLKIFTGDPVSQSEHFWGAAVVAVGSLAIGSVMARNRQRDGKAPILGYFL